MFALRGTSLGGVIRDTCGHNLITDHAPPDWAIGKHEKRGQQIMRVGD